MVQTAFPDQEIELVEVIAEGNFVVGRMIIRGTHQGEFMRIPRTRKRVSAELIEVVRIADGKIAERWRYLSLKRSGLTIADLTAEIAKEVGLLKSIPPALATTA
jgi:predicted SnoaL-like aldol condensation-catalyzing enzyme